MDSVVDRELGVRLPSRSFALVCLGASGLAAWLLPHGGRGRAGAEWRRALVSFAVSRWGATTAERAAVDHRAALSDEVAQLLDVGEELVMWQQVDRAVDAVRGCSRRLGAATVRAARWVASARGLLLVSAGVGVTLTAVVAEPVVRSHGLSAPLAALLVLLPVALLDVALPLADAGALSARTRAASARLEALDSLVPVVTDGTTLSRPVSDEVEVEEVDAGWGPRTVLNQVSLDLPPGARIAVVGPSGSGKSTLAALLLRFLDPERGTVWLGGCDLRGQTLDDVRRTVGLVDDDPHVFATTLVENVRLARPEASDAEVEQALRQARLGPWLDSLPEGLHTWLGDGHASVSGGERARLAVSRSLLARQPVLVLDEPTAHLDHATASALAGEILDGPRRESVLWITHGTVGLDLVDGVLDLGAGPSGLAPARLTSYGAAAAARPARRTDSRPDEA